MKTALISALLVVFVLVAGCGGDDDDDTVVDGGMTADAASADSGSTVDASGPGKLTVRADNVTGATNKIVLVSVIPQPAAAAVGAVCQPLTTSPASFAVVAKTPGAGDPCTLGGEATIAAGAYTVRAGIYTPGQMTPERCANTTVTIAGDTSVTLPAFATCP